MIVQMVPAFKRFWDTKARFKFSYGGRGGAKSEEFSDIFLEKGREKPVKILNTREVQKSIKDSVHSLYSEKIRSRAMVDYHVTRESITNKNGSELIFNGLQDHTVNTIKSLNKINYCWCEEAQALTENSIEILTPSVRAENSELWFSYNRILDTDPVHKLANQWVDFSRPRKMKVEIIGQVYRWKEYDGDNAIATEINWDGNPFFPEVLRLEKDKMQANDYDRYLHIWGGQPKSQADSCVFGRELVKKWQKESGDSEGEIFVGVDVARQGSDKTVAFKRKGLKIVDYFVEDKTNIADLAHRLMGWASDAVSINIDDTGVGGGVTDILKKAGFPVVGINNNGVAKDRDHYPDAGSEMWFQLAEEKGGVSIPDLPTLFEELTTRQYSYDNKGRRKIESKDDWKDRYKRSPDYADALLLCYYNKRIMQKRVIFDTIGQWSG